MADSRLLNKLDLKQRVGKVISQRRKRLALTQAQVAEKIGIEQESLSRIEKGITGLKFSRLEDLASVLECTVADFFRNEENSNEEMCSILFEKIDKLSQSEGRFYLEVMEAVLEVFNARKKT